MFKKVTDFLDGKKTYIVAIVAGVVAGLQAFGVVIPEWAFTVLGALGLYSARAAISKGG